LNQAQLLHDTLHYPDEHGDPEPWLIYFISKPLIGQLEHVSTIPPYLRERSGKHIDGPPTPGPSAGPSRQSGQKKDVRSFNELLMLFPMIARQMQPGLEKLFHEFEISFQKYKPLQLPPPSPASSRSGRSGSVNSAVSGDVYKQAADESEIRRSLEAAITAAADLFQRVDQAQLDLLASTTDLTGAAVDRLIERYVAEQLHDTTLFPRLCATQAAQDEELEQKVLQMSNVDLTQVGIPSFETQEKKSLAKRVARGITSFEKIGAAKSPHAMVEHLLDTARTLTKLDDSDGDNKNLPAGEKAPSMVTMNADMLVSLLLIVVIRAKVPHLHACLSYMRNFVFVEDVEQGEIGYILSTLEAVLFHILQDHTLTAASRANDKLWRSVRQGNIKAAKKILEKGKPTEEQSSSGDASDEDDSLISGIDGISLDNSPEEDASDIERANSPIPEKALPEKPLPEIPALNDDTTMNGDTEDTPEIKPQSRKSSFSSLRSNNGQSSSSVNILDEEPASIPPREDSPDDLPEEDNQENDTSKDSTEEPVLNGVQLGTPLDKEGPPPVELAFSTPTSPTTGVANVRIEALQSDDNDDTDSINSRMGLNKPLPAPRIAITRFDMEDEPEPPRKTKSRSASVKIMFPRTRSQSAGSISSMATISDLSVSSMVLSRTGTNQSQARDAFNPEKLSKTRNPQGESILMMAIHQKKSEMLRYLLLGTSFFDANFILEDISSEGATLLSAAVQAQDTASINLLLIELFRLSDDVLERYLRQTDVFGRTVAHYLFCAPDLISRLGRWLPWRKKDKNGQTPLFALCRSYDHPNYREMVGKAIKQAQAAQQDKAKLHIDEHIDARGNSLLHIAGDPAVVRMLLRCDGDVNAVNDKGFTPLMVASKYGRVEMVRTFFNDARVDLLARELRGLTAVELAKDDDVRNRIDGIFPLPALKYLPY
jgi:ankyrin repeat protein